MAAMPMFMPRTFLTAALFVALAAPAAIAESGGEAPKRSLSVVGEGLVRAVPDMATVTLGVVTEAATADAALAENSAAMARMQTALTAAGIDRRDLQTSGFSVQPRYFEPPPDQAPPPQPRIVGYVVQNDVGVRIRDLKMTGPVLDAMVKLGANAISGPIFGVAEPRDLEDQARRAAVRDALAKAALYAKAADVTLGPIARIEEGFSGGPQPAPMMAMAREAAYDSVPIAAGELTFQAQINVTWEIAE
jgi:uncharacterized protein YggE